MKKIALALAVVGITAGPALAGQCPALIAQIQAQTGNRLDDGAYKAKQLAAEAETLHKAGKHADSVKKAEEAAQAAGITLQMKK